MNQQDNLRLAQQFIAKIGNGAGPDEMAALCTPDLDWNIPGNSGVLPWVGHKQGRAAIADFIRDTQTMITRISLEITDVLASDQRAVIVGHLQTRINATGKTIDSAFTIILMFSEEKVANFLMLEDSYATSLAARL